MRKIYLSITVTLLIIATPNICLAGTAYISDARNGQLLRYDLDTLELDIVGSFGTVTNISGLAYNPSKNVMYGISSPTDSLYSIDLLTGHANMIGSFGLDVVMHGLAYNAISDTLLATATTQSELYAINMLTGNANLIATTSTHISGLAFDSGTGILYGATSSQTPLVPHGLYEVDAVTGVCTKIGTASNGYNGLAFDTSTNRLFGVENASDLFYLINQSNADRTVYANLSGITNINPLGLEFVIPEPATLSLLALGAFLAGRKRRTRVSEY